MNHRPHLLASIALVSISLLGCNQEKKEASPEPAATTATPATATTAATPSTEDPDKAGAAAPTAAEGTDKAGETNPEKAGVKTPAATVSKGEKSVTSDGKDLNVKNESGKGSVKTTSGGTQVTGKSGKSITVPGL